MTTSFRAGALSCALLASTCLVAPAVAQTQATSPFPVRQFVDANGVDLFSGEFTTSSTEVLIGDRETGLSFQRQVRGGLAADSMLGTIGISGSTYTVAIGGSSEKFTKLLSGSFTPTEQRGSTLSYNSSNGTYTYRNADGTVATFIPGTYSFGNAQGIALGAIAYPSGKKLDFHYTIGQFVGAYTPSGPTYVYGRRLQSVTSNTGYHLKFTYEAEGISSSAGVGLWSHLIKVTGLNALFDSCSTAANACTVSEPRPALTISTLQSNDRDYSDSLGRTTHYTFVSGQLTAIRRPGSSVNNITIAYTNGKVSSVIVDGVTTSYAWSDANGIRTVTITRGSLPPRVMKFDLAKAQPIWSEDELDQVTHYEYDGSARLTKTTLPEGNSVLYDYDDRGNVEEVRLRDKAGVSANDIVSSATYASACTVAVRCNKPETTTDAGGNVTSYSYDPVHGGLLIATAPAVGGIAPQVRHSYARLGSDGAASSTGMFRLTESSTCQTQASCAGTADEAKTVVAYGSNLLPASVTSGGGGVTATSSMTYDAVGNLLTADGPLAGTADTTRYRYDAARQVIGVAGPDPDGAGALKHRARRTGYNPAGQVTSVEIGTVTDQTDAAWSLFAPLETVTSTYDANARKVKDALTAGGTTHAVAQYSYDALGRPECVAQRMNSAEFASLPSSACDLDTPGSYGPDRISRTIYDAASQVTKRQAAVGTADAADEVTLAYRANGQVESVTDAEGNKTQYYWDGHDRFWHTIFPSKTVAGAVDTNDFERYSYDDRGNLIGVRLRDGALIGYSYDALGRQTLRDVPSPELDVSYVYDNLGRLTSATQTGHTLSFTWDALGRNLTQVGAIGTVTSAWDLAGRRTRLTDPSGLAIDYDYHVTGEVTAIEESTGFSLATFAYDDRGRRTSLTRGNGTTTSYDYDPVSRLETLTDDLGGASTSHDQVVTFGYNPASQIATLTRSNDLYAWTGHSNVSRTDTHNGLNQIVTIGGAAINHDLRGNITWDGARGYSYSSENLLTSTSNGVTLSYDPLGRLYRTAATVSERRIYDGVNLIAEYDGANQPLRRLVHGPEVDEPLVEYVGTGTRRWLHADERGSIVALSDGNGEVVAVNRYDEYGVPAPANIGRLGYTGQAWLPEIGLYYYKARMYHPTLGRFMQADPIGYGDGMNMYNYVGSDPVNARDPNGLSTVIDVEGCGQGGSRCAHDEAARAMEAAAAALIIVRGRAAGASHSLAQAFAINSFAQQQIDQSRYTTPTAEPRGNAGAGSNGGNGRDQESKPVTGVTQRQLAEAQKRMIRACAASQRSAACSATKALYFALRETYHRENPLPAIPQFEYVRPSASDLFLNVVGCGVGIVGSAGGVTGPLAAAACATAARDIGRSVIPEQRRIP